MKLPAVLDGVSGELYVRREIRCGPELLEKAKRGVEVLRAWNEKRDAGPREPEANAIQRFQDREWLVEHAPIRADPDEAEDGYAGDPNLTPALKEVLPPLLGGSVLGEGVDLRIEEHVDVGNDHRPDDTFSTTASSSSSSTSLLKPTGSMPGLSMVLCGRTRYGGEPTPNGIVDDILERCASAVLLSLQKLDNVRVERQGSSHAGIMMRAGASVKTGSGALPGHRDDERGDGSQHGYHGPRERRPVEALVRI